MSWTMRRASNFLKLGNARLSWFFEDDLKIQQELADRKQLAEAVANFGTDSESNGAAGT